jgi:hypothetical protein
LSHTSNPFFSGYFRNGGSRTICPGWPWTTILQISPSQVARITGVNPWHLACYYLWYWSLNSSPTPWTTSPVLFCDGFFFFERGSNELFAHAGFKLQSSWSLPPQ